MKPDVPHALQKLSLALLAEIAPAGRRRLPPAQHRACARSCSSGGEEFDRAAARRVEENGALRALFGDAARRRVTDAALRDAPRSGRGAGATPTSASPRSSAANAICARS